MVHTITRVVAAPLIPIRPRTLINIHHRAIRAEEADGLDISLMRIKFLLCMDTHLINRPISKITPLANNHINRINSTQEVNPVIKTRLTVVVSEAITSMDLIGARPALVLVLRSRR